MSNSESLLRLLQQMVKVLQEIFRSGIKNINIQGWKREGKEESEKL